MKFSNKILSQTFTQLCLEKGITQIIISPGSRNAPLTIGFAENPEFKTYSVVDERCAAFFAIGIAQQTKKPAVLVCTSGSALLNYYPAIAEAFYSNIPLIVVSADRPKKLIDIGDGQTIRQENVYKNHILYSANCEESEGGDIEEDFQIKNETEINIALNTAIELNGPVHVNIPFSEPLYETTDRQIVWPQNVRPRLESFKIEEDLEPFAKIWNKSAKKMILIGVLPPNSIEQDFIEKLAADESVIVLTETTSNVSNNQFFPAIDQLISSLESKNFEDLKPDILLTFGGMIVSKRIKSFLRNYTPKEHWHVDLHDANDTFFALNQYFETKPSVFLNEFLPKTKNVISSYKADWLRVKQHRLLKHAEYEHKIPFSDFKVFSILFKNLSKQIQLQLSNSATIRYAQLFEIDSSIQVFCNRGTSGIDGSTSTALGSAVASALPTILITGDLSFFYDSNALWNNYIPKNFKIIIINNRGGGIFRILPGEKDSEVFKTYFETQHTMNAKHLAEMYNFEYTSAENEEDLNANLKEFLENEDRPAILEIFTPSKINDKVLLDYFRFIA
ncbi:2-succinyl-5-enolpyruvyl-6-hydroxy-3-cyclohexene-1-carboxylic-acid synthase [Aequorivita echinoideorum]|uniref:2-succinyl-5-enolpyruvyl-6-hydroxy-3-cyclohexene-1-carboxylate synthase n=1 Tax=Aequorivita echinoideorum TaxID=1549647 RepID=A0ABS5S6W5_9FLAO|nr:2-succinyl-5-enolpyruvyl-6-hydroxy-3-cyclohexene-1-carboxylic-acid synthase [Aequorivita echinoideorum]MBT0608959.1 2-succinyl-5-enolpyruvyl-6-hydroxy-3-cyclohexene-1-carboxylic-acid synthase [Aequorivita echinoideorum]